jgi:hypothetical protein
MSTLSITALQQALVARQFPTILMWNRLEGRPRAESFARALRAEVRDALWMLTRQWQLGEFLGDDAGSPIGAQVEIATTRIDRFAAGEHSETYDETTPLEAKVERQRIAFTRGDAKLHLDLRVQLGRQLGKLLVAAGLGTYQAAFRERYPFALPARDRSAAAADIYAHPPVWQRLAALAGRAIDGGDLYLHLGDPVHRASDGIALADPAHAAQLDQLGNRLVAWFDALYSQPQESPAWQPRQLEYAFECAAPTTGGERVLVADQYPGGHLDWYAFDVARNAPPRSGARGPKPSFTRSFLPAPLVFDGMPHTRWWKFEDSKVSFGDISPATTDVAKLLLIEFALVYANDWFLIPFTLPTGSLATIQTMTVTNSFGERFLIEAAGSGPEQDWQDWRMYTLATRGAATADMAMFLAPAVPKIQNGEPLDEVMFVRDEMANMAWAIENRVPLATGQAHRGADVARETRAYHRGELGPAPPIAPYRAPIVYDAMTDVPEHWIPMLPVKVPGSQREVQLQRGRMLRTLEGDPEAPVTIEPATAIMRTGLDQPAKQAMFVHEEEVPRSGTKVTRGFQRTRWRDGRTVVWLALTKQTGRGEDRSGLAFDRLATPRQPKAL